MTLHLQVFVWACFCFSCMDRCGVAGSCGNSTSFELVNILILVFSDDFERVNPLYDDLYSLPLFGVSDEYHSLYRKIFLYRNTKQD